MIILDTIDIDKDAKDTFLNILQSLIALLTSEKREEEEKMITQKSLDFFKSFNDILIQIKIEQYNEIELHEENIKILESLIQNIKIEELKRKETDLINLLRKEISWLDISALYIKSFEKLISSIDQRNKIQNEIDIMADDLRKEGIIK